MRVRRTPVMAALSGFCLVLSCASAGRTVAPTAQQPTQILRCEMNAQVVGNRGGTVHHPRHELRIPRNALPAGATAAIRTLGGDTTGVRVEITPPGTELSRPLRIVIDARRCAPEQLAEREWSIWRVPDQGAPEAVPTTRRGNRFFGEVTRTSGFIIAN
jgi:hypothetical protein